MNFKTTYILFGILAAVLLIFAWTLWVGPTDTRGTAYVLPSMHREGSPLEPKDITRVEMERGQGDETVKLVFVRDSGSNRWRIVEPRDYQADTLAVDTLVRQIYNARLDENADVLNNPQQYGLEAPAEVVTLIKESEPPRQVTLNVGDVSPGTEKAVIYVTSSDRKEVMAVKKSELDSVKKTLADFRSRELLSPATGDIQAFALSQRRKDKVVKGPLELKKSSEERWVYVQPSYGDAQDKGTNPAGEDKPPSNVETVLSDISSLKVESAKDFVEDDAADLGEYNLDPAKDDILRIDIERVESIDKDEKEEKKTETKKVGLVVGVGKKVDDKSDQYYAYIDDPQHKDIVKIGVKSVARFLKLLDKPGALRDRNLVALGFRKPDAINVQNSWGVLEFRRASPAAVPGAAPSAETWKLWRGDKSYAVDAAAVQSLISSLTAPNQVEGFVDDPDQKSKLGLEKPDAIVRIWTDSLTAEDKKDEKKDDKKDEKKEKKLEPKDKDKPAFALSFGGLKDGKAAVDRKRGDEKTSTVVLVPAKVRDQVREGPLAYLDKQLPPFNADRIDAVKNVTKLALTRDGTTYEIGREDKADAPWKIAKPQDFAGRTADRAAVEDILRALNNLRAVKIESDKVPEDAKLVQWGLKEPRLKAVVTRMEDKKPKTFTFDFGKETADKSGFYLHASLRDMIVVADKTVVDILKRELLDPTVFHFDAAKVQEVKLTGWLTVQKQQLGKDKPLTLTFKRAKDGSGWEVEPKGSFELAASRLDDFLKNLADLKAVKFVAHKAKPSADQELDVHKGALHIELTVAGEKEPRKLTLTVGKADGNTGYFALSNQLSGDIFEVRKDLFDKVKEKPAYFSGQ